MSDTAPIVEPTAEAVNEAVPVVENVNSSKLLDIARKEAQFVKKEVEYKTKLSNYEKELEELKYFRGAKDIIGKNPEELLQKLGISYDELTKGILDYYDNKEKGAKAPTVEELRQEIAREFEQREAQKANLVAQQAVEGFNKEISEFVKSNEEQFPHLTKLGTSLGGAQSTEEFVFDIVSQYFEATGELLDLQTAAANAEEYFRDEWNKLNGVLTGKSSAKVAEQKLADIPAPVAKEVDANRHPGSISDMYEAPTISPNGYKRFKEKVDPAPTISNAIPVRTPAPFRERRLERDELISKAVAAYENTTRVKR